MAEQVRYFLERAVPELQDLKAKGLFEKQELNVIMRRRADFEQRIVGRGSSVSDFLRYAEFENNVERLRRKRFARMLRAGKVDTRPSLSDWAGSRRVLFIFERATKRFPANKELWARYLRFAKEHGAIKVVYAVYSRLLLLQPRSVDAWLLAAKYEFEENANAQGARALFQRALRLNADSEELWLAYAQFELTFISRLLARRRVLGLIGEEEQQREMDFEQRKLAKARAASALPGAPLEDVIVLPDSRESKDELRLLPKEDISMLGNPETNPALKGDVALTIFDACVPVLSRSATLPEEKAFEMADRFLALVDLFPDLNQNYLYGHILDYLHENFQGDLRTVLIDVTMPMRTVTPTTEGMAEKLQLSVKKFLAYKAKTNDEERRRALSERFVAYIERTLVDATNDGEVLLLLRLIIKRCKTMN